jgi:hypothetical protein
MSAAVDSQLAEQYSNLLLQTFAQRKKQALDAYKTFASATTQPLPGNVEAVKPYLEKIKTLFGAEDGQGGAK